MGLWLPLEGSINSPNKLNIPGRVAQGSITVNGRGLCFFAFFFSSFFKKRDLINESVTTVMFVGIKGGGGGGGGRWRTAGFEKRGGGHFNAQTPGKGPESGAQRAKAATVSKSLSLFLSLSLCTL